jgi:hypothetical protein
MLTQTVRMYRSRQTGYQQENREEKVVTQS